MLKLIVYYITKQFKLGLLIQIIQIVDNIVYIYISYIQYTLLYLSLQSCQVLFWDWHEKHSDPISLSSLSSLPITHVSIFRTLHKNLAYCRIFEALCRGLYQHQNTRKFLLQDPQKVSSEFLPRDRNAMCTSVHCTLNKAIVNLHHLSSL